MKRILITGGLGFIGSHIITALSKLNYNVSCLDKNKRGNPLPKRVKFISKDLSRYNPKIGFAKKVDIILHLASVVNISKTIKNPKKTFLNNINSTLHILEDIRVNNPKCLLVFTSSDKVYGNPKKNVVNENRPAVPLDAYGASKLKSELIIKRYKKLYGLDYIILRPGNVFGPSQKAELFIPQVISKIKSGKNEIKVGNLSTYRNFVYIDDLIDAVIRCIKNKNAINQTFNISSYNLKMSYVLKEIMKVAERNLNCKIRVTKDKKLFRPLRYESKRFTLNCQKAHKILKWNPKWAFREAIKATCLGFDH